MDSTRDILQKIINRKRAEVAACKENISAQSMQEAAYKNCDTRDFYQALKDKVDLKKNAVIAEIKKASPSKGLLRKDFDPVKIAKSFEQAGAACLSVLTDKKFFQGDNQYLADVRRAVKIPVLRKEFIIDPYQIYEARTLGADCILLIAACLNDDQLEDLSMRAIAINMDVLVEVHNQQELSRAMQLRLPMIGINNRDLHNFAVSLDTTIELIGQVADDTLIITESGILSADDVVFMNKKNIYSFLVGEAFMRSNDPGYALKEMFK